MYETSTHIHTSFQSTQHLHTPVVYQCVLSVYLYMSMNESVFRKRNLYPSYSVKYYCTEQFWRRVAQSWSTDGKHHINNKLHSTGTRWNCVFKHTRAGTRVNRKRKRRRVRRCIGGPAQQSISHQHLPKRFTFGFKLLFCHGSPVLNLSQVHRLRQKCRTGLYFSVFCSRHRRTPAGV